MDRCKHSALNQSQPISALAEAKDVTEALPVCTLQQLPEVPKAKG